MYGTIGGDGPSWDPGIVMDHFSGLRNGVRWSDCQTDFLTQLGVRY